MSISVLRSWSPTSTTVGNNVTVTYTLTLATGNYAQLQSFVDSSIGGWGTNFVSMTATDTSTPGAAVTFGPPTNTSTASQASLTFPGPFFCEFTNDGGVAQLTITFVFTATTEGVFGQPFQSPTDFTGTFSEGSFDNGTSGSQLLTITAAVCVAEGTLINLISGEPLSVQKLIPGSMLIGENGESIALKNVVKMRSPAMRFRSIEANQFGPALPEQQLLICEGHPIKIGNRVALPEQVGREVVIPEGRTIYTLVTETRSFVKMQGLLVATWSEDAWLNFVANDPRAANLEWNFVQA
jgi:hypothetical protein